MEPQTNTGLEVAGALAALLGDIVEKYGRTPPDMKTVGKLATLMGAISGLLAAYQEPAQPE